MESNLVYSTGTGRTCPGCGKAKDNCVCKKAEAAPKGNSVVRVGRETQGRKGKGVTVITGVPLNSAGLEALAKQLKQSLGTGGTVKERVIEIQGDHRDAVVDILSKQGYIVKRSGG